MHRLLAPLLALAVAAPTVAEAAPRREFGRRIAGVEFEVTQSSPRSWVVRVEVPHTPVPTPIEADAPNIVEPSALWVGMSWAAFTRPMEAVDAELSRRADANAVRLTCTAMSRLRWFDLEVEPSGTTPGTTEFVCPDGVEDAGMQIRVDVVHVAHAVAR